MRIEPLIATASEYGASDLHLEPGLPMALRIRGTLKTHGEALSGKSLLDMAQRIIGAEHWPQFIERRSFDLSKTIANVRCRINLLQTSRGIGLAVRLLASFQTTLTRLNLNPDLGTLVDASNGLILVSGPTGSGKSSTLAALIQEINLTKARHILTIESPIEYSFKPKTSYIRQREVGRDTPSFEQGLVDALREDPDVLMVGEMRDPETMRLTLNAAETGHVVLATVHSSTCGEALARIVSAFPAEIQSAVSAQLADCLIGAVAQRLRFFPDLKIRIPECEILRATNPVRAHIRNREFFKIASVIETGADQGMWSYQRYARWMETKSDWHLPEPSKEIGETEIEAESTSPPLAAPRKNIAHRASHPQENPKSIVSEPTEQRIDIQPDDNEFGRILKRD